MIIACIAVALASVALLVGLELHAGRSPGMTGPMLPESRCGQASEDIMG